MFADYVHYDGLGLAELIAKGEVEPKEVLEAAILRAEKLNPKLNAIIAPLYDYAHGRARESLSGPFAGVPFLLKDAHHALEGTPMSNGSRLHKGELSSFTSEIVRRFLDAGLVVFGKTNTPEYKLSAFTNPKAWGPTRNPWDVSRSAGGSSGGSAAAVAAGIVPMASATDEGGSIRIPAAVCGVFGLKPSRGRCPIGPDFSWEYEGLSTSLIISRTVRDTAAMLDATAGGEPGSAYGAPGLGGFLASLGTDPGQLRVGISTDTEVFGLRMDAPCVEAVSQIGSLLESLGHIVEDVALPYDDWEVFRAWLMLAAANTAAVIEDLEAKYGKSAVRGGIEDLLLLVGRFGRALSAEQVGAARIRAHRIGLALARSFERYDVLLLPTLGRLAVPLDETEPSASERRLLRVLVSPAAAGLFRVPEVRERVFEAQMEIAARQAMQRTMVANLTGIPAISVPAKRTEHDLPVGVQFLGRYGDEKTLLRLAAQLEQANPWQVRI